MHTASHAPVQVHLSMQAKEGPDMCHLERGCHLNSGLTSPSAGLTAICTLEPPHSTPISRMMATDASRSLWYSLSVSVCSQHTPAGQEQAMTR